MRQTYQGACHCGRTRFEVTADLDHVRACDCSICRQRGALNHRVAEKDLRLLTPIEHLSLYTFHTQTARDYFCPVCGIQPFRRPRGLTPTEEAAGLPRFEGWAVNVRCLEGVDLDTIPIRRVFGSRLP
ncbi:GFA family protein [Sphingobium nicotianae]|uniref:GFA family protein n=1 Tax=Sphingobium nicotianae TaxID=2782607 RepID=A0A9X1DEB1_9SPHN|nr:GFA family protein [Sphingobium nicotianae]MBT2187953.1 GFA family protein [Sphingobium nicotianae]